MPKVKVKLLNGEDQLIEFEDQMTVLDLKEKINKRLNIPTENQRLIYCGRILQNEKKLQEYDLDNKVIHLVDSPPNLDATGQPRQSSQNGRDQANSSFDASTTFGANQHISIDINLNGGNVHNRAESRIQNITRILGYINLAIDKLEQDPNVASPSYDQMSFDGSNDNAASGGLFPENIVTQSITEVGILLPESQAIPTQPSSNFLNQLSQDITDFLFNGAQATGGSRQSNATHTSASSNAANAGQQTSSSSNGAQPSLGTLIGSLTQGIIGGSLNSFTSMGIPTSVNISSSSSNAQPTSISSSANSGERQAQQPASSRSSQQPNSSTNGAGSQAAAGAQPSNRRRVTWAEFADILKNVQRTQERFTPHFNAFQQSLLQRHGSLSASQAEEEQARYRLIARCMHHLAHVWHTCSDIHINYTHQQDQAIQVFEPLHMRRPTYHAPATAEIVMTTGSINLGGGLLSTAAATAAATANAASNATNPSAANAAATNSSSSARTGTNPSNADVRRTRNDAPVSSLPNNLISTASINVQTESPISSGNNSQTATTNSNGRRESPWFVFSNQTVTPQPSASGGSSERTASSASNRPETRPSMFQNMFGASLPNLATGANGQPSSNTSVISVTTLQPTTVIVSRSRNASGNQPQQSQNDAAGQQSAINSLRDLFNFGSRSSTGQPAAASRTNVNRESTSAATAASNNTSSQTGNSSNQSNPQSSSSFFRMPTISQTSQRPRPAAGDPIGAGFPYSYIYNFDPHMPCTSTWLVPEIRGRLEVDLQIPTSIAPEVFRTNDNPPASSTASNSREAARSSTDRRARDQQPGTSTNREANQLFEDLQKLFSQYLERDELLRRIDRLPRPANDSLSSFIDSMKILDHLSSGRSNITLELFNILAHKISVVEFLKLIFLQDFDCLDRAKNLMIAYARDNLLFNSEEPFDMSGCVDGLLKIWRDVLTSSLNELNGEFSERTFLALLSELRQNLSVLMRTVAHSFNYGNEGNSFAASLYSAVQRLFTDFHTSLSQMFRNPVNVMRAYKNILIQIFPDRNVRSIVIGILSYRIPAIDESEPALERARFNNRVLNLTDQRTATASSSSNGTDLGARSSAVRPIDRLAATSSSASSSTPMEIDLDDGIVDSVNYGSKRWHFNCPRNWVGTLERDLEKNGLRRPHAIRFSSIYREAYKKS